MKEISDSTKISLQPFLSVSTCLPGEQRGVAFFINEGSPLTREDIKTNYNTRVMSKKEAADGSRICWGKDFLGLSHPLENQEYPGEYALGDVPHGADIPHEAASSKREYMILGGFNAAALSDEQRATLEGLLRNALGECGSQLRQGMLRTEGIDPSPLLNKALAGIESQVTLPPLAEERKQWADYVKTQAGRMPEGWFQL